VRRPHAGVVVVVQRFRYDLVISLGLFVHLHALVTDGAFADDDGAPRWFAAPSVTTEVIARVLATVHRRLGSDDDDDDTEDALVGCVQLSLGGPRLPAAPARVASPLEVFQCRSRLRACLGRRASTSE